MKKLNYQNELKKIINSKQLAEVFLHGAPTYKVAYLLSANKDFLTFAEVSSSAQFAGVIMCRMQDIDSISLDSLYLKEIVKQIPGDSLYQQALQSITGLKKFTFDGFISALENTKTVVEITTENEITIGGRIVGHDDTVIVFDEYAAGNDQRLAHTFFDRTTIIRISIEVPWLRTIARFLAEKKL